MKVRLLNFKKITSLFLAVAILITLVACGGSKDVVTEFKVTNDIIGTEVTFNLPGTEDYWEPIDSDFGDNKVNFTFYPASDDLDATNSWTVGVATTVASDMYKNILIDGEEPTDEDDSVVISSKGMKWVKRVYDDYNAIYGTCLDEFLDGYRVAEINIMTNGFLEDGEKPDLALFEKIEKTVLDSFKFDSNYEGKPDYSDAAYTGTHIAKWPFEIPFENGVIKAEEYADNDRMSVIFNYDDPESESISYTVDIVLDLDYDLYDHNNENFLDSIYFGPDASIGDEGFEEGKIAGHRAAIRFNYPNYKDEIVIEIEKDGSEKNAVFAMFTYINSDNDEDRADEKNEQKIIDMVTTIINSAEFLK